MTVAINGVDRQGIYINGVQVKQALDPTNETVARGVYDPTTLSAVDADLAVGNIRLATTIFGFLGTIAPGIAFADYHHYEDLAGEASYTPPAHSLSGLSNESAGLKRTAVHVEFWDGAAWVDGHNSTIYETLCHVFQDTDQNLRITSAGSTKKINLAGVTWSGYSANYHYYEDLANGATYTPSANTIASLFNELGVMRADSIFTQFYNGSDWLDAQEGIVVYGASFLFLQDNGQSQRVKNGSGTIAYKISLTGVAW